MTIKDVNENMNKRVLLDFGKASSIMQEHTITGLDPSHTAVNLDNTQWVPIKDVIFVSLLEDTKITEANNDGQTLING